MKWYLYTNLDNKSYLRGLINLPKVNENVKVALISLMLFSLTYNIVMYSSHSTILTRINKNSIISFKNFRFVTTTNFISDGTWHIYIIVTHFRRFRTCPIWILIIYLMDLECIRFDLSKLVVITHVYITIIYNNDKLSKKKKFERVKNRTTVEIVLEIKSLVLMFIRFKR